MSREGSVKIVEYEDDSHIYSCQSTWNSTGKALKKRLEEMQIRKRIKIAQATGLLKSCKTLRKMLEHLD